MHAPSFWDTIATPDLAAAGWSFFAGVDRFELADLPEGETALALWLEDRWIEKGKRLEGLRQRVVDGKGWSDLDE
jgi:hypothetical protein